MNFKYTVMAMIQEHWVGLATSVPANLDQESRSFAFLSV